MKTNIHFFIITRLVLLRVRSVLDKSCRENKNTHFVFSKFFFPENRAVYETTWKNVVEPGRPQTIIWRMRIACCIPKATNTNSEICNTHRCSTTAMVARTRHNVTLYVQCLSVCLFLFPLPSDPWDLTVKCTGQNANVVLNVKYIRNSPLRVLPESFSVRYVTSKLGSCCATKAHRPCPT